MTWTLEYLPEARKDLKSLGHTQQVVVDKALKKVKTNPLPQAEGGYGKPLGNKHGNDLIQERVLVGRVVRLDKAERLRVVFDHPSHEGRYANFQFVADHTDSIQFIYRFVNSFLKNN